MKITRALRALFFVMLGALSVASPASADRTQWPYGINPSSNWINQEERFDRLDLGENRWESFNYDYAGKWANVAVTASSGLYVQVAPATVNTNGSLYQFRQDDLTPVGTGATQLSADPTLIEVHGTFSTPAQSVGPLTPPSAAGQSVAYAIECQVQTVSRTPMTEKFEAFIGSATTPTTTTGTANRDLADTAPCIAKGGVSVATPTVPSTPTADTGYTIIATVTVNSGAATLSPSNIAMNYATEFNGFAQLDQNGHIPSQYLPFSSSSYVDLTSAQSISGSKTFTSAINAPYGILLGSSAIAPNSMNIVGPITGASFAAGTSSLSGSGVTAPTGTFNAINSLSLGTSTGNGTVNVPGTGALYFNYFSGSGGIQFCNGAQVCDASISQLGGFTGALALVGGGSYFASPGFLALGNDGNNSYLRSGTGSVYVQSGNGLSTYAIFGPSASNFIGDVNAGGNVNGVQGNFSSGLSASTGNFSSNVALANGVLSSPTNLQLCPGNSCAYNFTPNGLIVGSLTNINGNGLTVGNSYINASGVWSGGGYIAANGIFQSPGAEALCANNGALCLQVNNGRGSTAGPDVTTGGTIFAGSANVSSPGAYGWGSSTVGGVNLGANASITVQGIPGNVMRIAECTSTHSACDSGTTTFLTLNSTGDLAASGRMWANDFIKPSARALKKDIKPITEDPLEVVNRVRPVSYLYKTEKPGALPHYGLIADDQSGIISGPKHNYMDIGALAVMDAAAIKELAHRTSPTARSTMEAQGPYSYQAQIDRLSQLVGMLFVLVFILFVLVAFLFARKSA